MTLREKAIKQLRKSIPIEANEYTESRIQKLIKLWKSKKEWVVKSKEEGHTFTILKGEDCYEVYNASNELEGTADTLADAKAIAHQDGERVGY